MYKTSRGQNVKHREQLFANISQADQAVYRLKKLDY